MEYKIRTRDKLRLFAIGLAFYAVGVVWMHRTSSNDSGLSALSAILNLYLCCYGAFVLAKPFFSSLKADDRGFTVRIGLRPKYRVLYADVAMAIFDRISMRFIIQFEDGNKYNFEYIFEDINGFIKRLSQNGIDVQKVRSNPV